MEKQKTKENDKGQVGEKQEATNSHTQSTTPATPTTNTVKNLQSTKFDWLEPFLVFSRVERCEDSFLSYFFNALRLHPREERERDGLVCCTRNRMSMMRVPESILLFYRRQAFSSWSCEQRRDEKVCNGQAKRMFLVSFYHHYYYYHYQYHHHETKKADSIDHHHNHDTNTSTTMR